MTVQADQIVRLTVGTRYDVASIEERLIRVSWTTGDGSSEDHEGYDWGYYFAEDGTYLGADLHGIEPEFWLTGEEPVALAA